MGGTVKRRIAARTSFVLAIVAVVLTGSCTNNLTWVLQTWAELDMLEVRGGTMALGDLEGQDTVGDQVPLHTVSISTFEMSRYEVTQSLYEFIIGENPSWFQFDHGYADEPCRPVEVTSWQDAIEFCNALSSYAGLDPCYTIDAGRTTVTWNPAANGYRLPTEAEWEYASRGGDATGEYNYSGSDTADEVGWYVGNSTYQDPYYLTNVVGGKASNELGFYDMSGNVAEWCWDQYIYNWYDFLEGETDPRGPADLVASINSGDLFVLRGGAAPAPAETLRNAYRLYAMDNEKGEMIGFRVARNR